jgi:hypothetical protein
MTDGIGNRDRTTQPQATVAATHRHEVGWLRVLFGLKPVRKARRRLGCLRDDVIGSAAAAQSQTVLSSQGIT